MQTIEKSINVHVPVRTAYNQWTQFEEFPRFMEGVEEVRQLDDRHVHWTAEIAGKRKEWDAEISEQTPDQRISWHSVSGVRNAGTVEFRPVDVDETEICVRMEYEPEGMLENIAGFFNTADARVAGDLERFKEFVESRGSETGEWRGEIHEGASARSSSEMSGSMATGSRSPSDVRGGDRKVLQEAREELEVGKRQVQRGGVRARTQVTEERAEEQVRLREEHAEVERRSTDRIAEPGEDVFQERTVEIRETAEEPVVAKRTRVTGEVEIGKEASERVETVGDTLRRTDVNIEKLSPDADRYFRSEHERRFASSNERYEDYEPAYTFGSSLRTSYSGRQWNDIEADARRHWEARNVGPWERFKDAIRSGWEGRSDRRH
jgi:uncharacterized protein (TIGR02271 family)